MPGNGGLPNSARPGGYPRTCYRSSTPRPGIWQITACGSCRRPCWTSTRAAAGSVRHFKHSRSTRRTCRPAARRLGRPAHPPPVLGCLPEIRAQAQFITTGELPPDEIPPACEYRAERGDIETIITRLITRLRSSRNYHLALIDDPQPFPEWFYFGVKGAHVLAQVFGSPPSADTGGTGRQARQRHAQRPYRLRPDRGGIRRLVRRATCLRQLTRHGRTTAPLADWLEDQLGKPRHPS